MKATAPFIKDHHYLIQVALVVVVTAAFTYTTLMLNVRNGWNLLWMFLLPIGFALALNQGWGRRCFMMLALPVMAYVTVAITGFLMGGM
jgi:hypothetical protein